LLGELSEPGVVGVAAEIPRLNVRVPEARDEEKDRQAGEQEQGSSRDGRHCDQVSITRMKRTKEKHSGSI
jgi:hypothetical protein